MIPQLTFLVELGGQKKNHVIRPHHRYFDHLLFDVVRSLFQLFLQLYPKIESGSHRLSS